MAGRATRERKEGRKEGERWMEGERYTRDDVVHPVTASKPTTNK